MATNYVKFWHGSSSQFSGLSANEINENTLYFLTDTGKIYKGDTEIANKTNQISATAEDDDVVILTGTAGENGVTFKGEHAKKGPASGHTSGNTVTSVGGSYSASQTIKIPQITVDQYGHVTAAADESITITMPDAQTIPTQLKNPYALKFGNDSYDGSAAKEITAASLGLGNAIHFLGTSSTAITDGGAQKPTINNAEVTPAAGDVVLYGNQEFIYNSSNTWELFGDEGSYAVKTREITGETGLTGGGDLSANRTIKANLVSETKASTAASATAANNSNRLYPVSLDKDGKLAVKVPWANDNTDTLVKQTATAENASYPILVTPNAGSGTAQEAYYDSGITINPSTDTITATNFAGKASTAGVAEKLGDTSKNTGSTTKPIYLKAGVATEGSTYAGGTKVTLNGAAKGGSTASFYAPTEAGTSGQVLQSDGSGAPKWVNIDTIIPVDGLIWQTSS